MGRVLEVPIGRLHRCYCPDLDLRIGLDQPGALTSQIICHALLWRRLLPPVGKDQDR